MMFKDDKAFYAFQDGPVGQELLALVETKGLKGLGYVSNVPLDLFSTKRIATVADFAGKKVRAHSALLEHTVKALGGNPIAMPASEMFLAFQRGVIDGGFTTVTFAAPNKYQEVTKYVTRAAVSAIAYPVLMNLAAWNKLPGELKTVVADAAKQTIASNRAEIGATAEKAVSTLKAGGAEIIELTPAQRAEWQAKLQAVYDQATPRIGADLVKRARAAGG
jgi:C4-dicarboxylate-binding protein DctP